MKNKIVFKTVILLFILLLPVAYCNARWQYEFDRLSIKQGISQSDITDILQDETGFMWFATNNGLNRYDGYDFKTFKNDFRNPSSVGNNIVFSLSSELKQYMWVGTRTSIDRYDSYTGQFEHFTHAINSDNDSIDINRVTSIHICRDGEVWALSRGFIIRYDRQENQFYSYIIQNTKTGDPLLAMNGIFEDTYGRLLIATNKGLYLFDRNTFTCRLFFSPDLISGNRSSRILAVMVNPLNRSIYVGGEDGVFVIDYDGMYQEEILYNKNSVTKTSTLLADSWGRVWIGTSEKGLFVINGKVINNYTHDPSSPRTLGSNHILSLYEDLSGVLWIGTSTGGVSKLTLNMKPFLNIRHNPKAVNTLSDNVIFSIYVDEDSVAWISTKSGVLNRYDMKQNLFSHYSLPSYKIRDDNVKIHTIENKQDGLLWLGTNHGLYIFNKQTGEFSRPEKHIVFENINVRSFLREGEDTLWVASRNHGVFLLVGEKLITHYRKDNELLSDNMVRCIVRNQDGSLLVGTRDGGLNIVSKDGKSTQVVRELKCDSARLSLDNITALHPSSKGNLWIGTWGSGLYKIEDGKFNEAKLYNEKDGLSDNVIFSISEDSGGLLWISTYNGLACLDPLTGIFRTYTSSDGLASNEFQSGASYTDTQGYMWLGGIEGLTIFKPEDITASQYPIPRIAITKLFIQNQEVKPGDIRYKNRILDKEIYATDHITLSYEDDSFSFDLSSFSYGSEGRKSFCYMLKGLESEWKVSNQHKTVSYSNVKPGKYIFMATSFNADGISGEDYIELSITITPPWWKSNWAFAFYILLSILLLYVIILYYKRYYDNKTRRMHESLALENEQKLYNAKMRFYTNISHELRTPLTLIHGLTNRISNEIDENSNLGVQIKVMKRNTERLLKLINELLDLRRVETGNNQVKLQNKDMVSMLKTVWSYFESEADSKEISFSFHSDFNNYDLILDFEKTEKIVYNLFSNALKFTKNSIQLELHTTIKKEREYISISVKDNGIGIRKDDQEKIFYRFYQSDEDQKDNIGSGIGLHLAMELAKLQDGFIEVSSEYGEGATFTIYLPVDLAQEANTDKNEQSNVKSSPEEDSRSSVLIIDDNEDMRYYIRQSLADKYKVSEAANGKQGLEIAEKQLPDIIICDVMMPEMDGIEFIKRMKSNVSTSSIPIILATAKTSDEARIEGLDVGADAYISKPFTEEHLKAQVNTTLKLREEITNQLRKQLMTSPKKVEIKSPQDKLLSKIMESLEKNISNPDYDVDMLSKDVFLSRMHLYRQLKLLIGQSPSDFIRDFRLTRAADLLQQNKLNVAEITYMVGFSSPKYFSQSFRKKYGMSPNEYAAKNKNNRN